MSTTLSKNKRARRIRRHRIGALAHWMLAGVLLGLSVGSLAEDGAEVRYVIDKLLVGIYDKPADGAERLGLYPSGTRLELLERGEGFERVRTPDEVEGWIKSVYLGEAPTAALVLEATEKQLKTLEAEHKRTSEALDQSNKALEEAATALKVETDKATEKSSEAERLRGEVARLSARIEALETEVSEAQQKAAAREAANAEGGAVAEAPAASASPADALVQENTELKSRVASLRLTVSELEEKVAEFERRALDRDARAELALANEEIARLKAALDKAEDAARSPAGNQMLSAGGPGWLTAAIGLLVAFVLGGLGGIYLTDYTNRRRHGGFRV